jgi:FXSXX-COOH protein
MRDLTWADPWEAARYERSGLPYRIGLRLDRPGSRVADAARRQVHAQMRVVARRAARRARRNPPVAGPGGLMPDLSGVRLADLDRVANPVLRRALARVLAGGVAPEGLLAGFNSAL